MRFTKDVVPFIYIRTLKKENFLNDFVNKIITFILNFIPLSDTIFLVTKRVAT